jgi:thioredoxin reductase
VIATGVAYRQLNAPGVERFLGVHYGSATDAAQTYAGGHVIVVVARTQPARRPSTLRRARGT